ncbi:MAG: DUF6279 family lipoprotein [Burkholderiales bacterium]
MIAVARIAVLLAAVLLQGCSAVRLAYNNADVYLRLQANSFFSFENEQSEELDARIAAFLAWHRAHALPQYARLAAEAERRMLRGITRADLVWGYDSFRAQARESLRAAAAEMADLLDRLSPEQIARLERRLAEENRKFAKEQLQGTVEERRKRRLDRTLDRLEEWFGPLNAEQAARVRRYSERAPLSAELRDRERRRRQAEFLAMLRAREAKRRLADWAPNWERGREPAYAAAARASEAEIIDMLLDLDRTLSQAQRQAAAARFREYAADFDLLARR